MWDVWTKAWQATSARQDQRYGHTRRREQSEGRFGLYHGNGGSSKAASPVSLFETRPSEFEHCAPAGPGMPGPYSEHRACRL
jgi:hypothetical protein